MKLLKFDKGTGHKIHKEGSNFVLAPIMKTKGYTQTACFYLEAGGCVGRHKATMPQIFLVIEGEGWVEGDDQERVKITSGQAAFWDKNETHAAGTESGLMAIVIETDAQEDFKLPMPEYE